LVALPLGALEAPAFEIIDPRFAPCTMPGAKAERLWTGGVWVEGPAWLADQGILVWSDIPNDRMLAWHERDGAVTTFRAPSVSANGNTVDREGRLVTCEQAKRRITRTEPDGTITVLVDRFEGRRFNAPNDIVVKSDGTIWFSDPDYGKSPVYEGERELAGCHVYRLDPATGDLRQVTDDFEMPNGLAFSPDESMLYIIDTGSSHRPDGPNHVRRFTVGDDAALAGGEVIIDDAANYDGMRVDSEGRLWCGTDDGVRCYLPDGTLIGRINLPERAANLTFMGATRSRLMICGTSSLYMCPTRVQGLG
jgi:gluconolactonase